MRSLALGVLALAIYLQGCADESAVQRTLRAIPVSEPADLVGTNIARAYKKGGNVQLRNVIWVVADDLGSSDVGFNARLQGSVTDDQEVPISTPNIDALAKFSARFKNYYAAPSCGPSRSSLLTGRSPASMGNPWPGGVNVSDPAWKNHELPGDLASKYESVGNHLQAAGYRTHFIGKWGVDSGGDGHGPTSRGFHTFFGLINSAHNHYTKKINGIVDLHRWNETVNLDWPQIDEEPDTYSSTMFTREALNVISQHVGKITPFFLHLSYTAPHDPLQAPEEYMQLPQCVKHRHNLRRQKYCGMVQSVDKGVGEIVTALAQHDMLHNTIIMFTSDNGGAPIVGGYNYPFRGSKGSTWEGGVHVPGLLYAPGLVTSKDFNDLFHISDWSPTIQSMIGGRHPQSDEIDGKDQSKALMEGGAGERDSVVMEWNRVVNASAVVERIGGVTWKLVAGTTTEVGLFCREPVNKWSINADGATQLDNSEQIQRDFIAWNDKDKFDLEWAIHFGFVSLYDQRFKTEHSAFSNLPSNISSEADLFPTIPVTVEWDRVWLFNLDLDRTETNNVALQHKDVVEKIIDKYNKQFKDTDAQAASVYYAFSQRYESFEKISKAGILLTPVLAPAHELIYRVESAKLNGWLR